MVIRPSSKWQQLVEEESAELAQGSLSPDYAYASRLWPESLRINTDAALAAFEDELRAFVSPSDVQVLGLVQRLVVALNKINDQHVHSGQAGYETDEREELCDYINASLEKSGIDVEALEARHGIERREIAGEWRDW